MVVVGLVAALIQAAPAPAADDFWEGDTSSAWATASNWKRGYPTFSETDRYPIAGSGYNLRAVIGTDSHYRNEVLNAYNAPSGPPVISTAIAQAAGGVYLGLRERDMTQETRPYLNTAPAPGTLIGALTINAGGTLNNVTTADSTYGADGRIVVGADGRGYLTMTGGTLTGLAMVVGGEDVTTNPGQPNELGPSLVDLSGNATLTISDGVNGTATLGRRLRITGPSVNFSTSGTLDLGSSGSYTAVITSPTIHSAIHAAGVASVAGTLNVQFSGAGSSGHAYGETWDLVTSDIGIGGNFSNVGFGNTIAVSGLSSDPPAGAVYRTQIVGTTLQLKYDRVLVLHVNRNTGEMSITNPLGGPISIDGYSISSEAGSMKTTYNGISGAAVPPDADWIKSQNMTQNVVGENKDWSDPENPPVPAYYDTSGIGGVGVSLGDGFDRHAVADNDAATWFGTNGEDLVFDYTGPNGVMRGQVVYEGTPFENNLVLRVNPNTGEATLKNDSDLTLHFDGYSVRSSTGALSGGLWTGLGGTWSKSPATANALSETNLVGEQVLGPGAEVSIGDISAAGFATEAAQEGLSMEFILSEGIGGTTAPIGDYNENGTVDAADYTVWRDHLGTSFALPNRDPANMGNVSEADFTSWKTNFGSTGSAAGPETMFRLGAIVFDATLGAGAGALMATAVPEPGTGVLLLTGLAGLLWVRRRQPADAAAIHGTPRQLGVGKMWRQCGLCLAVALAVGAILFTAMPVQAATGGIALTNRDFELPGPLDTKVIAFEPDGDPRANIPGWTFPGVGSPPRGVEDYGHTNHANGDPLGDSGTEGGDAEIDFGNEMILAMLDGVAYQTSAVNVVAVPAQQEYEASFYANNIATMRADGTVWEEDVDGTQCQLTARLYYLAVDGVTRTTIGSPLVINNVLNDGARYSLGVNVAAGNPAIGRPIGVEFDCTSSALNAEVAHSWAGIDNVTLQITGILDGDLDGDGDVDLTDYGIVRDHQQQSQLYKTAGELNGDGYVNLDDFRAFKTFYAAGAGAGSGAGSLAAGAAVPEPSTLVLALMVLAGAVGLRFRKRLPAGLPLLVCVVIGAAAVLTAASPAAAADPNLVYYDPILNVTSGSPPAGHYQAGDHTYGTLHGQSVTPPAGGDYGTNVNFFEPTWVQGGADQVCGVASATGMSFAGAEAEGGSLTTAPIYNTPGDPSSGVLYRGARTGRYLANPWTNSTEGTYYISMLANYGTIAGGDGNIGYRSIEMWPDGGTIGQDTAGQGGRSDFAYNTWGGLPPNMRLPDTARLALIIGDPGVGSSIAWNSPMSYNEDGDTHLVVFKFQFSTVNLSDRVSVYLDPLSSAEPPFPSASVGNVNFTLSAIGYSQFGGGITDLMMIDEIRVGTAFASVLPPLPHPGDADLDGDVDLDDYDIIMAHMNLDVGSGGPQAGDVGTATGTQGTDGRVTLGDFRIWKDNYPYTPPGSGALAGSAVPEPASWLLVLAAAVICASLRCRQR